MQPQLHAVSEGFERAREHLRRLAEHDEARWSERPEPGRWSAVECVAHLNLTSEAYLGVIDDGLERAEHVPAGASVRYRLDPVGWMLIASMAPWLRMRVRTSAPFVPAAQVGRAAVLEAFERLQDEQLRRVERADGLALDRVRVRSSFSERVCYNLFSCLSFLPRHQERHLLQAERALGARASG